MSDTQRNDLAKVIVSAYGEDADGLCPCEQDFQVAEAILAAGYRKPRTITAVEDATRTRMVDILLAHAGTPRHKLFEYPHRDDDSREMIRKADAAVAELLAVLHESEAEAGA